MLVDGFNDLHGFRASVPDDGEFDGVMGFAVPVLHVSVKECGAALLTLLAQFRQSNVEEVDVGQPPWFAIGSSEMVVPCVRVGSLDRFGEHGDVARGASDVGNPYRFHILADIRGQLLDVDGLSMGELVTVNREIARAIREAKHARSL